MSSVSPPSSVLPIINVSSHNIQTPNRIPLLHANHSANPVNSIVDASVTSPSYPAANTAQALVSNLQQLVVDSDAKSALLERSQRDVADLQQQLANANKIIKQTQDDNKEYEQHIQQLGSQIEHIYKQYQAQQQQNEQLSTELKERKKQQEESELLISTLRSHIGTLDASLLSIQEDHNKLKQQMSINNHFWEEKLSDKCSELSRELDREQASKKELLDKNEALRAEADAAARQQNEAYKKLQAEYEHLLSSSAQLKNQYESHLGNLSSQEAQLLANLKQYELNTSQLTLSLFEQQEQAKRQQDQFILTIAQWENQYLTSEEENTVLQRENASLRETARLYEELALEHNKLKELYNTHNNLDTHHQQQLQIINQAHDAETSALKQANDHLHQQLKALQDAHQQQNETHVHTVTELANQIKLKNQEVYELLQQNEKLRSKHSFVSSPTSSGMDPLPLHISAHPQSPLPSSLLQPSPVSPSLHALSGMPAESIEELESAIQSHAEVTLELQVQLNAIENERDTLKTQYEQAQHELTELKQRVSAADARVDELTAQLARAQATDAQLAAKDLQLNDMKKKYEQDINSLSTRLNDEIASHSGALSALNDELSEARRRCGELEQELKQRIPTSADLHKRLPSIELEKKMIKESANVPAAFNERYLLLQQHVETLEMEKAQLVDLTNQLRTDKLALQAMQHSPATTHAPTQPHVVFATPAVTAQPVPPLPPPFSSGVDEPPFQTERIYNLQKENRDLREENKALMNELTKMQEEKLRTVTSYERKQEEYRHEIYQQQQMLQNFHTATSNSSDDNLRTIDKLHAQIHVQQQQINQKNDVIVELSEKLQQQSKLMDQFDKKHEYECDNIRSSFRANIQKLQEQHVNEMSEMQSQFDMLQANFESYKSEKSEYISQLKSSRAELSAKLGEVESEYIEQVQSIQNLVKIQTRLEKEIEELKEKHAQQCVQLQHQYESESHAAQQSLMNDYESAMDVLKTDLSASKELSTELQTMKDSLAAELDDVKSSYQLLMKKLKLHDSIENKYEPIIQELQHQLSVCQQQIDELQHEKNELLSKHSDDLKSAMERAEWLSEDGLEQARHHEEREVLMQQQQQELDAATSRLHQLELQAEELTQALHNQTNISQIATQQLSDLQLQHQLLQEAHAKLQDLQLSQYSSSADAHEQIVSNWNQEKLDLLYLKDKHATEMKHQYEQQLSELTRQLHENAELHRANDAEFHSAIQVLSKTQEMELEQARREFKEKESEFDTAKHAFESKVNELQSTISQQQHLIAEYDLSKKTVDSVTKNELEQLNLQILSLQSQIDAQQQHIQRMTDNHRFDLELLQNKHTQAMQSIQHNIDALASEKQQLHADLHKKQHELTQLQKHLSDVKDRYTAQSHQLNSDSQLFSVSQKSLQDAVRHYESDISLLQERLNDYKAEMKRLEKELSSTQNYLSSVTSYYQHQLSVSGRALELYEVQHQHSAHFCEDQQQLNDEIVRQFKHVASKSTATSSTTFIHKHQKLSSNLTAEYSANITKYESEIMKLRLQLQQPPPAQPVRSSVKSVPSWDDDAADATPFNSSNSQSNNSVAALQSKIEMLEAQLAQALANRSHSPLSTDGAAEGDAHTLHQQINILKEKVKNGKELVQTLSSERKQLLEWKHKKKIEISQLKSLVKTLESSVQSSDGVGASSSVPHPPYPPPSTRSALSVTPSSASLSGYALRLNTEMIILRQLDIDIYATQQQIEQQVHYLIQDYTQWRKELKRYGEGKQVEDKAQEAAPRNPAHARLIPELLKEFDRVEESSLQRSPQIVELVQSTFKQLQQSNQHKPANHQHIQQQLDTLTRKDSEFILQSDLQLVYVGKKTPPQAQSTAVANSNGGMATTLTPAKHSV